MTAEHKMLATYRRVDLAELWKIHDVVEDALVRWESRVYDEPSLRIRIREGYESLAALQQAIEERIHVQDNQRN